MKILMKRILVAVSLAILAACSATDNVAQNDGSGGGGNNKNVIGNPDALGTAGVPNHMAFRGRLYAMMGLSTPNTTLDTFLTNNKNIFNGTGEVPVTPEDIQKKVESIFQAAGPGVAARASSHLSAIFQGVNFGAGPAAITDAQLDQIAMRVYKMATGNPGNPGDANGPPADFLQNARDFRAGFVTGATNNSALTTSLMVSLVSAIGSMPTSRLMVVR